MINLVDGVLAARAGSRINNGGTGNENGIHKN